MISYHKANKGRVDKAWGYVPFKYSCSQELWAIISQHTWSPIVFAKNYRLGANFLWSDLCALDVDNKLEDAPIEYTIEQAKRDYDGLRVIIGTTRSHQIEKNKEPPRDRYRIIVPFEQRITDPLDYTLTMRYYAGLLDSADDGATDTGRQFYPCKELVFVRDGDLLPVRHATDEDRERIAEEERKTFVKQTNDPLPKHIQDFLNLGTVFGGSRNKSLYVTSIYLLRKGFANSEILEMFDKSPFDRTGLNAREVETALKSAHNKK